MKTTLVKKAKLIETLKSNLTKHKAEYQEAIKSWAEAIKEEAKEVSMLTNAEIMGANTHNFNLTNKLPKPMSHEDQYNEIIKILEFEEREELELDYNEIKQYLLDDWGWKDNFVNNTMFYKNLK